MIDDSTDDGLPSYHELVSRSDRPSGSSWGVWGDDDVFGSLNLLTPERVTSAAKLVRKGAVFPVNWEMELPDPPLFGRAGFTHRVNWLPGRLGHDDELDGWNTQSSSQWDGFRHLRSVQHGFYSGVADAEHGVHHWARRGVVGRAVILDIARWRSGIGRPLDMSAADPIDAEELLKVADYQDVSLQEGDVLLIRTGWIDWYKGLDDAARKALAGNLTTPGLRSCERTAELLWDLHVAAVAADNPALEVYPPEIPPGSDAADLVDVFAHMRLLPLLGIPIGELFDLDRLAEDCVTDGVWEGLFTSAPLNLRGGVASPPNALVIK
ncbi:cyclase family protein [Nocardia sp. NBC_00508]|uniref:cyclase family protein n=1 Tax=Nocardia sp. NBC_00508 TaxID=2975992 RepID=UPI002E81619D|nr:cyclase family protein [Nocardia sp. NBC_00508]WUD67094.1 cyclase family protein [Nocardia sp. NBC_00508]